ncbi:hypothetical protein ABKV19_026064, partial [Rosa sericea]
MARDQYGFVTHLELPSKGFRLEGGYNSLTGLLLEDIYNATTLEQIKLPSNSLYGAITDKIVNLTALNTFDLSYNNFSGVLPPSLGKLSKLKLIVLDSNNLEGHLPPSLMNCANLVELGIRANCLEEDISTFNFSKLSQLSGEMAGDDGIVEFDGFQSLELLDLSCCGLTGEILGWLSKLKKLEILNLNSNRITGSLPSGFPKELCRLLMLVHGRAVAQADRNHLELPIFVKPEDGDALQYSSLSLFPPRIYLSNNNMNGSIPSEIGQMQFL